MRRHDLSLVAKKLRSLIAGADRKLGNANKHHGLGDNISTMRRNQLVKWLKRSKPLNQFTRHTLARCTNIIKAGDATIYKLIGDLNMLLHYVLKPDTSNDE